MRSLFRSALLSAALVFCAAHARAELVWNFWLDTPDLGIVMPTDILHVRATIHNDISSTEILRFSSFSMVEAERNGVPHHEYSFDFGKDEPFPWPSFTLISDALQETGLAPGESLNLDFATATPVGAARAGKYTLKVTAGHYWIGTKVDQLSWQVAAVPEPQTYAMLLAGVAVLGAMARCKRTR